MPYMDDISTNIYNTNIYQYSIKHGDMISKVLSTWWIANTSFLNTHQLGNSEKIDPSIDIFFAKTSTERGCLAQMPINDVQGRNLLLSEANNSTQLLYVCQKIQRKIPEKSPSDNLEDAGWWCFFFFHSFQLGIRLQLECLFKLSLSGSFRMKRMSPKSVKLLFHYCNAKHAGNSVPPPPPKKKKK